MSAIGYSSRPGCRIASQADYRREHFVFERTQSAAMRGLEWESRIKPLRSWSDLLLPWAGFALLVGAAAALIL